MKPRRVRRMLMRRSAEHPVRRKTPSGGTEFELVGCVDERGEYEGLKEGEREGVRKIVMRIRKRSLIIFVVVEVG